MCTRSMNFYIIMKWKLLGTKLTRAALVAQVVKNLPENAGDVGSILGWEGRSVEKEMTTHSSVFAWRIPWTEEPGGLESMGSQKNQT